MEKRTIDWADGAIVAIDQCALPHAEITLRITDVDALIDAITRLAVRGAPALGGAGALGVALLAQQHPDNRHWVREQAERLAAARPTAANLRWGVHPGAERGSTRARPPCSPRRWTCSNKTKRPTGRRRTGPPN